MADRIRVGIVGATVTQGGSGWGLRARAGTADAEMATSADARTIRRIMVIAFLSKGFG